MNDGHRFAGSMNRYRVPLLNAHTKYLIRKFGVTNFAQAASISSFILGAMLPQHWLRVDRPIFIIGCSRSGTTLFVDMFKRHRDLANLSEAPELFDHRYWNPDIDHVKTAEDATHFQKMRLRSVLAIYISLRGKRRFVNKHVDNSLRIPFLNAIFPDALFIHMYRDGRAVIRSNCAQVLKDEYRRKVPFGFFPKPPAWRQYVDKPLVERFALQWIDIVTHIRHDALTCLKPNQYLEIPYEEFCEMPHSVLRRADAFCSLHTYGRDFRRIPERFDAQNSKWHEDFTAEEQETILRITGRLLAELGYIRDGVGVLTNQDAGRSLKSESDIRMQAKRKSEENNLGETKGA